MLDRQCHTPGFLNRMTRVTQVVKLHLEIGVIERLLKNSVVRFEDCGAGRLGLLHHVANRPLEHVALDGAVESHQDAELPLRCGVPRFLRKPNVQLPPRQRECPVITFHPVYLSRP
ncbi:hypothetical protein AWC20_20190 [Mycobacterium parmense]|nr:hypothetical protein AWC20_20190 [Mycobacterium parmense]